jgi:hypothetical protein
MKQRWMDHISRRDAILNNVNILKNKLVELKLCNFIETDLNDFDVITLPFFNNDNSDNIYRIEFKYISQYKDSDYPRYPAYESSKVDKSIRKKLNEIKPNIDEINSMIGRYYWLMDEREKDEINDNRIISYCNKIILIVIIINIILLIIFPFLFENIIDKENNKGYKND